MRQICSLVDVSTVIYDVERKLGSIMNEILERNQSVGRFYIVVGFGYPL